MLRGIVGEVREDPIEREQKDALRLDLEARLRSDYGITANVTESLFDSVLLGLEEEYFYEKKLLPAIVANRDLQLRESFLRTSGVDRFRIEELEAAYLKGIVPRAVSTAGGS
jgi:uncharacterized protein (TIGR04442 family)